MKGYRNLIPIALVILMVISIYTMISDAVEKRGDLNSIINSAEHCIEQKLYYKAISKYQDAISIKDDIEYYLRIIDVCKQAGDDDVYKEWVNNIVDEFPKEPVAYEVNVEYYKSKEEYVEVFSTIKVFYGRNLTSEKIDDVYNELKFYNYETSLGFTDITMVSGGIMGFRNATEKWGLANSVGSILIDPKFKSIGYYANEYIAVQDDSDTWYLMDSEGVYQYNISANIEGKITDVGIYNAGLLPVCVDGKYNYYTIEFEQQFGGFDYAGPFYGGVAAVKNGTEWQVIDTEGNPIVQEKYADVILDERGLCGTSERLFVLGSEGKYKMIDNNGQQIGSTLFDDAKPFVDGLCAVKIGALWGFADNNGSVVIEPKYENANSFSANLAAVCKNGKWGYVDAEGTEAVEYKYDEAKNFSSNGSAFVKSDEYWNTVRFYKYDA